MSIDFIKVENANTFLTKVSEEIDTKHIHNFVRTQIQSQNLTLDNNSVIFYLYLPSVNSYLISLVNSKTKNIALEPFVFLDFYIQNEENKNSIDLFICKDFFALYDNKKLIYFNKIERGFLKNDIVKYINQTLKKQIDNIYDIKDEKLELYKKSYVSNIKKIVPINFILAKSSKSSLYFLTYLAIVIFMFSAYYVKNYVKVDTNISLIENNIKLNDIKKEYESLLLKYVDNQTVMASLVDLFYLLNENGIKLKNIKVSQGESQIIMFAENKNKLLDFLDYYDEDSTINHLKYIKEDNSYEMVATIRLHK